MQRLSLKRQPLWHKKGRKVKRQEALWSVSDQTLGFLPFILKIDFP